MIKFEKWQGCGNDFIMIDKLDGSAIDDIDVKKICDRHFGIGADGVIFILPSNVADVKMRIFNSDGTEPEMCGNGIRCFARYLFEHSIINKVDFPVETGAGVLNVHLTDNKVTVNMGRPILEADKIPVDGFGNNRVINETIEVDNKNYKMTCVSMGNPHCVIFVDSVSKINLNQIGSLFEINKIFPRRTNTEFAEVISNKEIRMRVWERGAGITLACGTGACATAVAGVLNNLTDHKVKIILDGGDLEIDWSNEAEVYMTGAAEKVFAGQF